MSIIERYHRPGIIVFFGIYLIVGLSIFKDYGVHVDQDTNANFGRKWGKYIEKVLKTKEIIPVREVIIENINNSGKTYIPMSLCRGPFWQLVLYKAENVFCGDSADSRDIIFLHRLLNFLLFYISTIIFYLLGLHIFKDQKLAFCGVLIFIFHPRIFADSFYNTADLSFLSFYTIAIYTLVLWLEKKNFSRMFWHAIACALAVDIRVPGLLLPFLTVSFLIEDLIFEKEPALRKHLLKMATMYFIVFSCVVFLFWPLLWSHPFTYFIESIKGGVFNVNAGKTPAKYNLLWIAVTTPPAYLLFFIIGCLEMVKDSFKKRIRNSLEYRALLAALFLFVVPITLATVLKTGLYNSWRHHYFVYSAFVIICLFGVEQLLEWAKGIRSARYRKVSIITIAGLILLSLLNTFYFMVRAHPFQFIYANILAKHQPYFFDDYWAVTGRRALEYILAQDQRKDPIPVGFPGWGAINTTILSSEERARITVVKDLNAADYLIVTPRDKNKIADTRINTELFHSISFEDIPLILIYKKKTEAN